MKSVFAVLSGLLAVACASMQSDDADVSSCNPPTGWEDVAERAEGRALFIGEMHGSNEIPDAFYRYVCAVSARGGRTVVALEYPSFLQDAFDAALASKAPREELLKAMETQWRAGDGRGSKAMLDLVMTLHALEKEGREIELHLIHQYAGVPDLETAEERRAFFASLDQIERQQMGDAGMAEKIAEAGAGAARTIILMGSFHANKDETKTMPRLKTVPVLMTGSLSLIAIYDGGNVWAMQAARSGVIETGASRARPGEEALAKAEMAWADSLLPAFDGYLYVGTLTPSPPALPPQ